MSNQLSQLASKFRGALAGALIGDCIGAPFEGEFPIARSVLSAYMSKLLVPSENKKALQVYPYTDDTAMTKTLGESLVECKAFDATHMAKSFCNEYFKHPKRGYGSNVPEVFIGLKSSDFEDPFRPAKYQFQGSGSYGNGAAMRICPAALFAEGDSKENLIELAKNCSIITHAHANGYNGAILQSLAIRKALLTKGFDFETLDFLSSLTSEMQDVEKQSNSTELPFTNALRLVKEVLENSGPEFKPEEIARYLGNDVSALRSVPTAIFVVLRAQKPISTFETDNMFVRALYLSISIGGDTDTIASMACAIVGALHGMEIIPWILVRRCEDFQTIINLSTDLYSQVIENKERSEV